MTHKLQKSAATNHDPKGSRHYPIRFENASPDNLLVTMGRLQERLNSVTFNGGPERESETLQFQKEIEIAKQCLDVCKEASQQVSSQKLNIIGEVIADDDCDQVVVTTLADLFNIAKVKAKNRTMQLVGSMPAEALRDISKDRYGRSRL